VNRSYQNSNMAPIWVLIAINCLIFLATLIRLDTYNLLGLQYSTFSSHPWTIVTSLFTHAGWWHILGNMYMLWFYGSALVQIIGEKKFLALYFIGGLVGNALFLLFMFLSNHDAIGMGASGAIFAIGGALAVVRPRIKVIIFPIPIPMDLWVSVIISAVILGILPAFAYTSIGWQAHLGGVITGLAAGYFFRRRERRRPLW
jgi:uncharacterized protein